MADRVSLLPAPASTGTRPPASSTVRAITRSCSSALSVALSPVVPHGTSTSIFPSTCRRTSRRRAASSSAPSFLNGVTSATPAPAKDRLILASEHRFYDSSPLRRATSRLASGIHVSQGLHRFACLRRHLTDRRRPDAPARHRLLPLHPLQVQLQLPPLDAEVLGPRARHVPQLAGIRDPIVQGPPASLVGGRVDDLSFRSQAALRFRSFCA